MLSFRRRGCAVWVAACVLTASLALPVSAFWHLTPDDDAACASLTLTQHPFAQFEVVQTPFGAEHCALCHWSRALGGAALGHHEAAAVWLGPGRIRLARATEGPRQVSVVHRPSRAPPASPL